MVLQNAASEQGLHCPPLILNFLDISQGRQIDLFKFKDKEGKEF